MEAIKLVAVPKQEVHLHFSYSQLNTYLMCPMKYAHLYVWGTPWETRPAALAFGKAIHKAVEVFYRGLMEDGEIKSIEDLQDVFLVSFMAENKKAVLPLTFKKGEDIETLKALGNEFIRLFHENAKPQKIVAVEFPFSVKVPDILNGGDRATVPFR